MMHTRQQRVVVSNTAKRERCARRPPNVKDPASLSLRAVLVLDFDLALVLVEAGLLGPQELPPASLVIFKRAGHAPPLAVEAALALVAAQHIHAEPHGPVAVGARLAIHLGSAFELSIIYDCVVALSTQAKC